MGKNLQVFLDLNLFELGDKDERLKFLDDASIALYEKIKNDKAGIVHHALLLLGMPVASDEPLLLAIETLIKENGWTTLQQAYPTRSMPLIQAVTLDALDRLTTASHSSANLIWLACADRLNTIEAGRQKELVMGFFMKVRDVVQRLAAKDWITSFTTTSKIAFPSLDAFPEINLEKASIEVQAMQLALSKASGPSSEKHGRLPDSNPHWAHSPQEWAYKFADIGSREISKVLDSVYAQQSEYTEAALYELQDYVQSAVSLNHKILQDFLKEQQESAPKTSHNIERRSQLLWWKAAKYSTTLQKGYREVPAITACMSLAKDLSLLSGQITPLSMDYFLREAVREVLSKSNEQVSISTFLRQLTDEMDESTRKAVFAPTHCLKEPRILGDFLLNLGKDVELQARTGIHPDRTLSWEEFAVQHFHYLQLQKNLSQK